MAHRSTLFGLMIVFLIGGVIAPCLALAGYRMLAGDGFSTVLAVSISLLVFFLVVIMAAFFAIRSRR